MNQQDVASLNMGFVAADGAPGERLADRSSVDPHPIEARLGAAEAEIHRLREALAASEARQRALTHELHYRVRNMLAVIRSIARRSQESGASQEEFAEHLEGRLAAVARYYSQVDDIGSAGIQIEDMLRNELIEGQCLDGPDCTISGPPVHLHQKSAELMGLAFHELTTNSIKFGALAQGGKLAVVWSVGEDAQGAVLRFQWTETGVSVTSSAPRPFGFGRQLIEEALPYELGAMASFTLKPGGIECSIVLPLSNRSTTERPPLRLPELVGTVPTREPLA